MKKLFVLFAFAGVLVACNNNDVNTLDTTPVNENVDSNAVNSGVDTTAVAPIVDSASAGTTVDTSAHLSH